MKIDKSLLDDALALVRQAVDKGCFPGATVAIGHKNGLYGVWRYGKACIYPSVIELNMDTFCVWAHRIYGYIYMGGYTA
jgi:hypothetical protein